ncbi:lysylphosphatidylglycerol synthase transmembrane domain-containing protein [Streptacidiphilus melanogenes]|uniref:lysylphosphatidylglycerol synthase transmembrane domain-containing protein n=1 Tax=Streptacidiphilus melanogenes TaxID=411235 RepID=UPI00069320AF|nr:lysylphosphatidylglycerol synthase transmembrane domain-containing protein [Streptacidiphilus melanogenes]
MTSGPELAPEEETSTAAADGAGGAESAEAENTGSVESVDHGAHAVLAGATGSLAEVGGPPKRLRMRRVVTLVLCAIVVYVVLLQVLRHNADPLPALERANAVWLVPAVGTAALGSLGATFAIVGFVPERVSLRRALLAQLSGFFVNLATPGGLGSAAVNTRFLARSGIAQTQALASVALGQIVGFVLHLGLLVAFGTWIGANYAASLPTGATLLITAGSLAACVGVCVGVPRLRRWLAARLREAGPRLRELMGQPGKLTVGILGQLAVTLMAVASLYFCARAFGQGVSFPEVGFAQLVGSAVGSAIPMPGGIGSSDAAQAYSLQVTTGIAVATWVPVVLVYRLCTFWLPLIPGWISFLYLQKREAL